jgi:hypothetical protein
MGKSRLYECISILRSAASLLRCPRSSGERPFGAPEIA